MIIIVVNAGSSSVKLTCFGPTVDSVMAAGMVERIGSQGTLLHYRAGDRTPIEKPVNVADTAEAVAALARHLVDPREGCLNSLEEVRAVGHRVVHGGEKLNQPMVVDAALKDVIREYFDLAPLHNPPNLEGIEAAEAAFPRAVHVGIFDTAFHSTIPAHAFMYALPLELYRNDKIRRYGFHGISHQNVSLAAARFLGRVDAVVFTAGIGENSPLVREKTLAGLSRLGITVDPKKNRAPASGTREISGPVSPVKVLVVPTREEREIAGQVMALLATGGPGK